MIRVRGVNWRDVSLVAVLGVATAAAFLAVTRLPVTFADRLVRTDVERSALNWRDLVIDTLGGGAAAFEQGEVRDDEPRFLDMIVSASDVYRFKLFTADGHVFWSTRESDIGTTNSKPYFMAQVAAGRLYFNQAAKPAGEVDGFRPKAGDVYNNADRTIAEIYVPVFSSGGFAGAVEFYTDVTEFRGTLVTRLERLIAALSAAGLLSLVVISASISRAGRRSMRALEARSRNERAMMDDQVRLTREVRLLGELNEWLQSASSLDELFEMVARFLSHMLPGCAGSVYVYSNSRDVLDGQAAWNDGIRHDHIRPDECWGLRRGRTYPYHADAISFACAHVEPHDQTPYLCIPILAHGETVGLMHLKARPGAAEGQFFKIQRLAQMCAEQISMAIANVRMRDELQDQSIRDPLTGLFNRRHMMESLRRSMERVRKNGGRLNVLSLDIDHFKRFNDNHGHDAGDIVLRSVGSVLETACDGDEIACRMGGEEFMILLPDLAEKEAAKRAEAIRKAVEDLRVRYGEKTLPQITLSVGLAHFPGQGNDPQELIRSSDDALYDAKAKGRNRVRLASGMDHGAGPAKPAPGKEPHPVAAE